MMAMMLIYQFGDGDSIDKSKVDMMDVASNKQELMIKTLQRAANKIVNGDGKIVVPQEKKYRLRIPNTIFHGYPELFIQIEGVNQFRFPDQTILMEPGDIMLIPAELSHGESNFRPEQPFLHLVAMLLTADLVIHLGESAQNLVPIPTYAKLYQPPHYETLHDATATYQQLMLTQSRVSSHLLTGLQLTILGFLIQQLQTGQPIQAVKNKKVAEVIKIISVSFSNTALSVKTLSEQIGCNSDYLSHLFCQETGTTLTAYLLEKRMEAAREYLAVTTMTISEIAWACGYENSSYFTYQFRKRHDMTPSQFRKQ